MLNNGHSLPHVPAMMGNPMMKVLVPLQNHGFCRPDIFVGQDLVPTRMHAPTTERLVRCKSWRPWGGNSLTYGGLSQSPRLNEFSEVRNGRGEEIQKAQVLFSGFNQLEISLGRLRNHHSRDGNDKPSLHESAPKLEALPPPVDRVCSKVQRCQKGRWAPTGRFRFLSLGICYTKPMKGAIVDLAFLDSP